MTRRSFRGNTQPTTLAADVSPSATSLSVASATNFPDGTSGPFVLTLDLGQAGEEKVLVASRSGTTMSGLTRGFDGTTAVAHSTGAPVAHTLSAVDLDEANAHINSTGDVHPQYLLETAASTTYVPQTTGYVSLSGTLASRPAAGTNRRIFTVTSGAGAGDVYLDTGTTWKQLNIDAITLAGLLAAASSTITGGLTISGSLTVGEDVTVAGESLARGLVASAVGPGSPFNAASGTLVTLALTPPAGRRWLVLGSCEGRQLTSTAEMAADVKIGGTHAGFMVTCNVSANEPYAGNAWVGLPVGDGTTTYTVTATILTGPGTSQIGTNTWGLFAYDTGS